MSVASLPHEAVRSGTPFIKALSQAYPLSLELLTRIGTGAPGIEEVEQLTDELNDLSRSSWGKRSYRMYAILDLHEADRERKSGVSCSPNMVAV